MRLALANTRGDDRVGRAVGGAGCCLGADSCDAIRTFADGKQPSREIFISTSGSNTTGNGSRATPFQTLSAAARRAARRRGRLLPGTYPQARSSRTWPGRRQAPIWLGGVPGEARPVISGGTEAIHLSRVRNLIVENLEIAGATGNGLQLRRRRRLRTRTRPPRAFAISSSATSARAAIRTA